MPPGSHSPSPESAEGPESCSYVCIVSVPLEIGSFGETWFLIPKEPPVNTHYSLCPWPWFAFIFIRKGWGKMCVCGGGAQRGGQRGGVELAP